jgi:hypothetical protein
MGDTIKGIGGIIRDTAPIGDVVAPWLGDKLDPGGAAERDRVRKAPPVDQRIKDLVSKQSQQAKDFRGNLGNYKEQQSNAAGDVSRRQLASDIAGVQTRANSRGLLYSGLRQGSEIGAASRAGSDLAKKRMQINQEAESQADDYDSQALQSGVGLQQLEQQRLDRDYEYAIEKKKEKSIWGDGSGKLVGGLLGG